jgi:RNA polymerase sigma-70 factor, ECF subfamily
MHAPDGDPEALLARAGGGDAAACQELLARHRERLRQMIAVRRDRRLLVRVDPSDVVQEALTDAWGKLPGYLQQRPLPFYPWLRQLALERLIEPHRQHVRAQKRSVFREQAPAAALPDESLLELAGRLVARGTSPSGKLARDELRLRVQQALLQLGERDREILVLRYLEQLSTAVSAAVLGITEGAAAGVGP